MQQQPKITYRVCSSDGAVKPNKDDPFNIFTEVHSLGINIEKLEKTTQDKSFKPKIPDIMTCIDSNDYNTWIHIKNNGTIGFVLKRTGHDISWRQEVPKNIVNIYCVYGLVFLSLNDETVLILNEENGTPAFPTVNVSGCVRVFQQVGYDGIIILSNFGRMLVWTFGKDNVSGAPIVTTTFDQQYPLYFGKTLQIRVEDTYELKTMQLTVIIDDGVNKLWYSFDRQAWVAYEFNSDFFDINIEPETLKALEDQIKRKQKYHDETLIDTIAKITKVYLDVNLHDRILALYSQICQMGMCINIFCNKQFIDYIEVMNNILMDQCPELIEIVMASREYQAFTGVSSEGAVSIKAAILAQHPPLVVSKLKQAESRSEHKRTIHDAISELKSAAWSSSSGERVLEIVKKLEEDINSGKIHIADTDTDVASSTSDTDIAHDMEDYSEQVALPVINVDSQKDAPLEEVEETEEKKEEVETKTEEDDIELIDIPLLDDEYSSSEEDVINQIQKSPVAAKRPSKGGKLPRKAPPKPSPKETPKIAQMRPRQSSTTLISSITENENTEESSHQSGSSSTSQSNSLPDQPPSSSPVVGSKRPTTGGKIPAKRIIQPEPVQRTGPVFPQQGMTLAKNNVKMPYVGNSFYQIKKSTPDNPIVIDSSSTDEEELQWVPPNTQVDSPPEQQPVDATDAAPPAPEKSDSTERNAFPNGFKSIQQISTSDADLEHIPLKPYKEFDLKIVASLNNYPSYVIMLYNGIKNATSLPNQYEQYEANPGCFPIRFSRFFIVDLKGQPVPKQRFDYKPIMDMIKQIKVDHQMNHIEAVRRVSLLVTLVNDMLILCFKHHLYGDVIFLNVIMDYLFRLYLQYNKKAASSAVGLLRPELGKMVPSIIRVIRIGIKRSSTNNAPMIDYEARQKVNRLIDDIIPARSFPTPKVQPQQPQKPDEPKWKPAAPETPHAAVNPAQRTINEYINRNTVSNQPPVQPKGPPLAVFPQQKVEAPAVIRHVMPNAPQVAQMRPRTTMPAQMTADTNGEIRIPFNNQQKPVERQSSAYTEDSQVSADGGETTEDSQLVTDDSEDDSQVDSQVSDVEVPPKGNNSISSQSEFKAFDINESDWI